MTNRSTLDYASGTARRKRDWLHWASVSALVVAGYHLLTSPLILSKPGGFVDAYLWTAAFCLLAASMARKRFVLLIALLVGFAALILIHRDHEAGMAYTARSARDDVMAEFELGPYAAPTTTPPATQPATAPTGQPTEFINGSLDPNTTYYYYVRAHNLVTDSAPSNTGNATTQSANALVFTQLNLDCPDSSNPTVVGYNLYWGATAGFAPSFEIQMSGELEQSSFVGLPAFPLWRDGVPVHGSELDPEVWSEPPFLRNPEYLAQVLAEPPDPRWPMGTDHTNNKGKGIAEDTEVQNLLHERLVDALINTFP